MGREVGVPIVVVRLEAESTLPTPSERTLQNQVWANQMYYVDTRSAFRGRNPRDYSISMLDRHPNEAAHAIFADVIDDFLRSSELLGNRDSGRSPAPRR